MNRSLYFSKRISHFLKGYRKKKGFTQEDLAKLIGATKSTVSRIENDQDKQVALVLNMLERLGSLESMDLGAFLTYLDQKKPFPNESTLFPWQKTLLSVFSQIKQSLRLDLTSELFSKDVKDVEQHLNLMLQINRLTPSAFSIIENLVNNLYNHNKNN